MSYVFSKIVSIINTQAINVDVPAYTKWCIDDFSSCQTDFINFVDELRKVEGISDRDLIRNFDKYLKKAVGKNELDQLDQLEYELYIKVVSALIYSNRGRDNEIG